MNYFYHTIPFGLYYFLPFLSSGYRKCSWRQVFVNDSGAGAAGVEPDGDTDADADIDADFGGDFDVDGDVDGVPAAATSNSNE
jgi:hypothetical protein